jgi:hypothetical protein
MVVGGRVTANVLVSVQGANECDLGQVVGEGACPLVCIMSCCLHAHGPEHS